MSAMKSARSGRRAGARVMALAKTTRPALAATIARPRLFRWLDGARRRSAVWVWAPPGAGKTSLVASYLAARKGRTLWYQVDRGDDDVGTFFYYLAQAAPRRRPPLPLLTAEYRQGLAIFARRYFRELYARLRPPFDLVFDDYQEVAPDAALHLVMGEALEEIPKGVRVIFISRSEPPAAFARHRARRTIDMLEGSELRFTQAETGGLVRGLAPGRWSKDAIRSVHESVDGWAAGLVLQLEQSRGSPVTAAPIGESSEVIFDYFAGEILARADAKTQEVLLQTAFLPHVTPSMAQALTGQERAGEILAALHKQNYFTKRQSGSEPTYEYHPLFREFLRSRALSEYTAERMAALRRTAAGLLDDAGRIEAAAGLLREAGDWESLAQLIHRHGQTLLTQGRAQTLEEWLDGLPPAMLGQQPWLLFWRGIGWLAWRHADCERTLAEAFTAFRAQGDTLGMFLAWTGVVFAYVSSGEHIALDRWIALLDEITGDAPGFPTKGVETRVACAMLAAILTRQPNHPHGAAWAERAIELGRRHPDPFLRAMATTCWLQYQWQVVGDLSPIAPVVDEMRALMRSRDLAPVARVNAGLTVIWYEAAAALPSYRQTMAEMLELAQGTGMFFTAKHVGLTGGLMAALSHGDLVTAAAWLRELERDIDGLGPGFRHWHHWFVVWDALLRKDLARATSYQPEMLRLAQAGGRPLDEVVAHLMSAQLFQVRGDEPEARAHLDRAFELARMMGSPYFEFMARLIEAQLCFDRGEEAAGLEALRTAMSLGRRGGYSNTHTWLPDVMARLCARALGAGIEVEYVSGLVRARGLVPETPPVEAANWPWPIKIFTLGRFEIFRDGKPVRFSGKVQRKPLALLKALISLGGRGVSENLVADALWPDAEGDAARAALTTALHRLRALLGHEQAVTRQDGQLTLDARICWVDVWAIEHALAQAEATGDPEASTRKAAGLYRGAFLDGADLDLPKSAALADGLRRRLLRQMLRVARQWEPDDRQAAVTWYEEALRVDPCAEDACRSLMSAHHGLGRPAAVLDVYERCRVALGAQHGTSPSAETRALLDKLVPRSRGLQREG